MLTGGAVSHVNDIKKEGVSKWNPVWLFHFDTPSCFFICLYAVGHSSEQSTCTIVCPTAFSTLVSICSIVSLTVCHVGPKELCWQSG